MNSDGRLPHSLQSLDERVKFGLQFQSGRQNLKNEGEREMDCYVVLSEVDFRRAQWPVLKCRHEQMRFDRE